ncbi:MAG: hypothetical protein ACKOUT_09930 [Novosphingobium sp.]
MGKYEPLTHYLEKCSGEIWEAGFADVERVLGFPLPRSAHEYPAWWANQDPGHSQTRGWRDAGWETGSIDLSAKKVQFRRRGATQRRARPTGNADLWNKAREISGISDRDELIEAALTALIRREAAKRVREMGGSMPDFSTPARERPTW